MLCLDEESNSLTKNATTTANKLNDSSRDLQSLTAIWCYRCRTCCELFTLSQGLAKHQSNQMS
ncbi:hypothetical protein H5410_004086 [Solanum commersonii]|uniref:C2H2-type domain-containing protein n=1 Tax=Solanum commersonii TaxID=4109 RepID=A0A9J6B6R8_SOLCO|nr:hypothetical protein H5410_004086 [Solanum commersonii]